MLKSSIPDATASPRDDAESTIFCQHDLWYFRTREGDEIGPFRYRNEAQLRLDRFLAELHQHTRR